MATPGSDTSAILPNLIEEWQHAVKVQADRQHARDVASARLAALDTQELIERYSKLYPESDLASEVPPHTVGAEQALRDYLQRRLLDADHPMHAARAKVKGAEGALDLALRALKLGDRPSDPSKDNAHYLMPHWLGARLPRLYATEQDRDPIAYVKLFTPDSSWTWYLTEYERRVTPEGEEELAFGLVFGLEEELGYIHLPELREVRGPLGLPIERDLYFAPQRLSVLRSEHNAHLRARR